jgi:hypothetical protein
MDNAGWSSGMDCSVTKVPVASESARFLLRDSDREDLLAVGEAASLLVEALPFTAQKSSSGSLFSRSSIVALANRLNFSAYSQLFPSLP